MKLVCLPVISMVSTLFSGYAFCTPLRTSEAKSVEAKDYYIDRCHVDANGSDKKKEIVCGEQICDGELKMVLSVDEPASVISTYDRYNLATYIMYSGIPDVDNLCLDKSLLNNKDAGYSYDELEGIRLQGVLKLHEVQNGQIHYLPFRTSALKKKEGTNDSGDQYFSLTLAEKKDPSSLTNPRLELGAAQWHIFRHNLRRVDEKYNDILSNDMKLKKSNLTLRVRRDEKYPDGKVYFLDLTGFLKLPYESGIDMHFVAYTVRFAKPGYNSYRKDVRYKRSVSMVPQYIDESAQQISDNGVFKLIEIIVEPFN